MKLGDARVFSVPTFSSDTAPRASTPLDRWVVGRIRASVPSARLRFVLWDGFDLPCAGDAPVGTIVFRNRRALFSWLWNPDLNFGEAYMFGAVELQGDLVAMLCEIYRALRRSRQGKAAARQPANDERAARENVHRHYDLGNDFYRLWLDREMLYTCAYFPSPGDTLEAAQIAKMDRVCRKLRLQPGERVVEAGCGWGSLALYMARQYGVSVRADRLCAGAGERRGPRRSRRVRRGRLSQRSGPVRRLRVGWHARARWAG
jgi:cyclopropane-fatty-acyl-phospholipid synthase